MVVRRIEAVDHVEIEAPMGIEEALRWFYGDVIELPAAPAEEPAKELRFRSRRVELRIRLCNKLVPTDLRPRVTLRVGSLAAAREKLEQRGVRCQGHSGLGFTDRALTTCDPAGHVVELRQAWPEYPL